MNIKKIGPYAAGAVQNPKGPANKVSGEDKAALNGTSSDRVKLSKDYQDIVQAKKVMTAGKDIRTEKVEQVRVQLESGNYEIKPEEIAGKMMEEVL